MFYVLQVLGCFLWTLLAFCNMLNFIIYIIAVVIGLFLFWSYNEEQAESARQQKSDVSNQNSVQSESTTDFRLSSVFAVLGLNAIGETHEEQLEAFTEHFTSFDEVYVFTDYIVLKVLVIVFSDLSHLYSRFATVLYAVLFA